MLLFSLVKLHVLASTSTATASMRKGADEADRSSVRTVDQAFEQALELAGGLVAIALDDMFLLADRQRIQSLGESLAAIGDEHQHLAAIVRMLDPINQRIRNHSIDHLRQRRMIEQHGVREFAHGIAVPVRKDLQDPPLLDRYTFLAQPRFELPVDFTVGLGEQVSEVLGNRGILARRFGHG